MDIQIKNFGHISVLSSVRSFFEFMYRRVGCGFHPDDPMSSYGVFSEDECTELERLIEECFDVCEQYGEDIYEISIDAWHLFSE